MFNSRDAALALVEEGLVSAEQMLSMCLGYMSRRCCRYAGR
jgi:hypothetical protein